MSLSPTTTACYADRQAPARLAPALRTTLYADSANYRKEPEVRTVIKWETGFTIIELMVVLVLISILALTASIRLGSSSDRAYIVTMQSDLRNIATAQEAYIEERLAETGQARYASGLSDLDVNTSNGVQIRMRGDRTGWSARATHQRVSGRRCAVVRGTIQPFAPASSSDGGKIVCD